LGSALTVKSLPCVSMIAPGKVASLASKAAGKRVRARVYKALTSGEASVERVQLNYSNKYVRKKCSKLTSQVTIWHGDALLTRNSDRRSQIISCDTSGMVNVPFTSVPSLAVPCHFMTTLQSKIVINLTGNGSKDGLA
jgi:hypothetical protein